MAYGVGKQIAPEAQTEAVRKELATLIASPVFKDSDRLIRFLSFVVDESLAGRAANLKESVIGMEVFDREAGYDPKADPIVRVQARRLRTKLETHYSSAGQPGELQIVLPKGGYAPEFFIAEAEPAPEAPAQPKSFGKTVPLAIALVVLAVVAGFLLTRRSAAKAPSSRLITAYPGYQNTPTFSPDGQTIAFSWGGPEGGDPSIYVQRLDADTPRRLTNASARDRRPVWLPDGEHIGFLRDDGPDRFAVMVVPVVGAGEQRVATVEADSTAPPRIEWSRDGKKLYSSERMAPRAQQRIVEIDLASGQRRTLTQPGGATAVEGVPGDDELALSPDGKSIAFRRRSDAGAGEVFMARVGGDARQVTHDNSGIVGLAWSRDGQSLIVSSRRASSLQRLWRFRIDGGEPVVLTDASLGASFPSVSARDGSIVYASRYLDSNIWRIDLTGRAPAQRIIASNLLDSTPRYSPDGAHISFRSNRTGNDEVWITDADGKSPARLTNFGGPVTGSARWSPDGQYLVFDSRPNGNSDILLIPSAGGRTRQLTHEQSNEVLPCFSFDGKSVYFASDRTGVWQIWKQSLDGGEAQQITHDRGFAPQESPDHRWLYYSRPDTPGLFRLPLEGGPEQRVLESLPAAFWGAWALTGDKVLYFAPLPSGKGDPDELRLLDPTTGVSTTVTTTKFPPIRWDGVLAVSPDGHYALAALIEREGSEIHLQSEP